MTPDLVPTVPRGMFHFIGRRLIRSFITLVLFQLVVFGLIQVMNALLPNDIRELAMKISAREELGTSQSPMTPPGDEPGIEMDLSPSGEISIEMEPAIEMEVSTGDGPAIEMDIAPDAENLAEPDVSPGQELPVEQESTPDVVADYEPVAWWDAFIAWMTAFYRGDLGRSNQGGTPVVEILKARLPRTLMLLIPGTIGGFLLGMWLGKVSAWKPKGWKTFGATLGGVALYTSFAPWLAFVIISVFSLNLNWFPPEKLIDPNKWYWRNIPLNNVIYWLLVTMFVGLIAYMIVVRLTRDFVHRKTVIWRFWGALGIIILLSIPWIISGLWDLVLDILDHLVLPLTTLILLSFGETMLIMKTTMTDAVAGEHVTTAQAKGVADARVRDRHAARVAILPVLTRFVVHLPFIIIGSFVVEHFFYWDGMGQELIRAANDNDLPVLLGVLSIVGIGILLTHTVMDILAVWLDPRLRETRQIDWISRGAGT